MLPVIMINTIITTEMICLFSSSGAMCLENEQWILDSTSFIDYDYNGLNLHSPGVGLGQDLMR